MMMPCSICGAMTDWCCSDCRIDTGNKVYVCNQPACREAHEALKVCAQGSNVERIKVGGGTIRPIHGMEVIVTDYMPPEKPWMIIDRHLYCRQEFWDALNEIFAKTDEARRRG